MYIDTWDSFYQQVEELYVANPLKTRYVTKFRHCDGKMVLKVTDDVTCLKYKTDQQADLKRIEKLNKLFLGLMATGETPAMEPEAQLAAAAPQQAPRSSKGARRKG